MQLFIGFVTGAALVGQERENALNQKQAEQEKFFHTLQEQAKDSFKQLATDSLKEQKAELITQNKDMVSPLKETLDKFTKQVGDLRTESTARHGLLQNAIERTLQLNENLSQEAQNLTEALKSPKKQGTWGEIILEDVLTAAGLRKGIEFDTQVSFTTDENQRRQPDCVLHLPNQRDLVIDSKMSLTAYLQWQAASAEEDKQKFLKEHVQSVEKHIKELASENSNVKYISFSRNFGKESAIFAGLKYASGDYICLMDADLQHPPKLIPEMLEAVLDEGYDVAAARRLP